MKIILVAAVSRDLFITDKSGAVARWTSDEDKAFFSEIKKQHALYVMGSGTYDKIPKPLADDTKRIVLTSRVNEYTNANDQSNVSFENVSVQEFVQKYEKNYASCLLLGGSKLYTDFLDAHAVDEIYLTIEPVTLHEGTPLLQNTLHISSYPLHEAETKVLNNQGTVLKHYRKVL